MVASGVAKKRRLKTLPWGTLRSWVAYAIVPMVGIVTAPILARALGPEGRGAMAAVLQPLTVADAFAAIGIPAAITYFVAKGVPYRYVRRVAMSALAVSCSLVMIALVIYSGTIAEVTDLPRAGIILLWCSVIVGTLIASRRAFWQAQQSYLRLDFERVTGAFIRCLLVVILFVLAVSSPLHYAAAFLIAGIVASLILFGRQGAPGKITPKKTTVSRKRFLQYAALASFGTIAVTLNNRLDQAILPALLSARDLGYYAVAVTVAELPLFIGVVMVRNLLAETSAGNSRKAVLKTALVGVGGVFAGCLLLMAIVPWLIPWAFGREFESAVSLTRVLLLGSCIAAVTSCLSVILTGRGRPGLGSLGPALGALATIVLLGFFWSRMTIELAAILAVIAQSVAATTAGIVLLKWGKRQAVTVPKKTTGCPG